MQDRLADFDAPLVVRILRGIWRLFFGAPRARKGVDDEKKGGAEGKEAAKVGTKEPLAEERAAFMTPEQRRASHEADAE